MVDNIARKKALDILNRVKTDKISNWQLEDEWPKAKEDLAINCIFKWLWTLYDDGEEAVLIDCLSDQSQAVLDRCCEFLNTDLELQPANQSIEERASKKLSHGIEWDSRCTFPEDDYWPFPSPE